MDLLDAPTPARRPEQEYEEGLSCSASVFSLQSADALRKRCKLQEEVIRELEEEAMEMRGEKGQLRLKVHELEHVCRLQSLDMAAYRRQLDDALAELALCRETAVSQQQATMELDASRAAAVSALSEGMKALRVRHEQEMQEMAHRVAVLESKVQDQRNKHVQEVGLLRRRARAMAGERDVFQERIQRLSITKEALSTSVRALRDARDEAHGGAGVLGEELVCVRARERRAQERTAQLEDKMRALQEERGGGREASREAKKGVR